MGCSNPPCPPRDPPRLQWLYVERPWFVFRARGSEPKDVESLPHVIGGDNILLCWSIFRATILKFDKSTAYALIMFLERRENGVGRLSLQFFKFQIVDFQYPNATHRGRGSDLNIIPSGISRSPA